MDLDLELVLITLALILGTIIGMNVGVFIESHFYEAKINAIGENMCQEHGYTYDYYRYENNDQRNGIQYVCKNNVQKIEGKYLIIE
jgi:hypothetical protein